MKKIIKMMIIMATLCASMAVGASAASTSMAEAYLEVLNQRIAEYGTCEADSPRTTREGLTYADLIDVDGDGTDELFFGYFDDPYDGGGYVEDYDPTISQEEFFVEIWDFDGTNAYQIELTEYHNGENYGYQGGSISILDNNLFCSKNWSYRNTISYYSVKIYGYEPNSASLLYEGHSSEGGGGSTGYLQKCVVDGVTMVDWFMETTDMMAMDYDDFKPLLQEAQAEITAIYENTLAPYNVDGGLMVYDGSEYLVDISAISELEAMANADMTADDLLAQLPYNGDASQMKMSAEQAAAFAKVIKQGNIDYFGDYTPYNDVALFDAGNGVVGLWATSKTPYDDAGNYTVAYSDIWMWDGSKAVLLDVGVSGYEYIGISANDTIYQAVTGGFVVRENMQFYGYYNFNNGVVNTYPDIWKMFFLCGYYEPIWGDWYSYITAIENGDEVLNAFVEDWVLNSLSYDLREGSDAYIVTDEYDTSTIYLINGKFTTNTDEINSGFTNTVLYQLDLGSYGSHYWWDPSGNWADATTVSGFLSSYAEAATVTEIDTSPNLVLDFAKVNTLTGVDEFVAYIKSMLADLNGDGVNDASKSELVTFIENAITAPSTVTIGATNNVVNITANDIANGVRTATDALVTYEDLLESEGVELNKSITLIIRIIGNQLDVGEPMEVILNSDLADSLDAEVLQIYLGSSNHAIQISAENLKILVAEYGSISVQIQCNDDGNYTINFLDAEREIIEQMPASVTVFLPCDSEFYTVMARYGTQSDNWGGQFSAVDNTISFTTPYTGIYELLDNSQNIADISDLPADTQNAIKFMISKGFFTTDEDENFRPYENLLRQDATKALVSMFFTLDRSLTCDFPDVAVDSYYYSYVASAAADDIVLGYDDGTFGGGDAMTTEQLLAIVSRTLVEKKGYVYPTDMSTYLSSISGANSTSAWAQEAVALAIREGIILSGESIDPTAPITRTDAALYLYRLFMLLEEVNPVAIDMDIFVADEAVVYVEEAAEKKSGNLSTAIIAGASATAIILAVGAVYIKKRK